MDKSPPVKKIVSLLLIFELVHMMSIFGRFTGRLSLDRASSLDDHGCQAFFNRVTQRRNFIRRKRSNDVAEGVLMENSEGVEHRIKQAMSSRTESFLSIDDGDLIAASITQSYEMKVSGGNKNGDTYFEVNQGRRVRI